MRKPVSVAVVLLVGLISFGCVTRSVQNNGPVETAEKRGYEDAGTGGDNYLSGVVVGEGVEPEREGRRSPLAAESKTLYTNQKFIESLYSNLNVNDVDAVFVYVFFSLPEQVYVYPTENYYYFSFYSTGRWFWGNIRLGVEERKSGALNFVYYEYIDDPKSPDESPTWHKEFGAVDGVALNELSALRYKATYRGKSVIFNLNDIGQDPPRLFKLRNDEELSAKTFDESGYRFFLIFDKKHSHFMWILNEEQGMPGVMKPLSGEIVYDALSGFAFYVNKKERRKILIGIWARNVRRNNYWDGPFDQLADNYVNAKLAEFIQRAYPYTRSRIDKYGKFIDEKGFRVAITPYYEYESLSDLLDLVEDCKKQPSDEFYPCITYDYKTSFGSR
ncbi:MAG: hypothetical protein IH874_01825 [Candidatus Dadabacteria bacterium]|nr:hypothetical protein [Candidatus Dadabacteria bacterium]